MSRVVVAVGLLGCGGSELAVPEDMGQGAQEIVGGVEARPGSWPWIVSLQRGGSHFCGGSLIRVGSMQETDIVLTAAHCVVEGYAGVTVVAGAHDFSRPTSTQVAVRVERAVSHPQYNPDTTRNDIAVLKLERPIRIGGTCGEPAVPQRPNLSAVVSLNAALSVQAVCLPAVGAELAEGTMASIAGWGLTREGGYDTSSLLLQVDVPIVGDRALAKSYQSQGIVIDGPTMLGAGYAQGGKDACQGDSGGPLVVRSGTKYVLHGITSFGVGCGRPGLPGVYTQVSSFLPWIQARIAALSTVR
ncbi:serine protease [Myxococcus sp. K38C18041901]|uniref:serine protease n=1 Tax=Myxococcus guangdongensis TaxID=2906760 RepID=UPI0020A74476|nr:trypsin-like serine protease [Myxococcus guangdongensis]MCP3061506.1 serine protease [Myxococcus guangdongensis]